jgi:hypothetical protein
MTKRTIVGSILLALVAGVLVAPSASSAAGAACVPGTTKDSSGKKTTRFCGPAKAVAKVGAKTLTFSGGSCDTAAGYYTVNIGAIVNSRVAGSKPGPQTYFGLTVYPADSGVHLSQVVAWNIGGKRYTLLGDRVTLKSGLKSGSFSGKQIGVTGKITGTFTCE